MKSTTLFHIPQKPKNSFNYVTKHQDVPIYDTVKHAIDNKNILLQYQPVVHAQNPLKIVFYEGLIRIFNSVNEIIPAKDFIPCIEKTELGRILDCYALELGLTALVNKPTLRLAINISVLSIEYPRWIRTLEAGLKKIKLLPND